MNPQIQKPPTSIPLIFLFLIIAVSAGVTGIIYYNYQKDNLLTEKLHELSAISDLKIRQITQWRFERLADGKFLGDNVMLVEKISDYLNHKEQMPTEEMVRRILKSLTENYDYRSATVTDRHGDVRIIFPARDTLTGDSLKQLLNVIARDRKVVMTDLHLSSSVRSAHLDLIVPLIDRTINDTIVQGFLILRIDPGKVLYPLLQSWPTASRSAETLMVRKEGDQIVYLNNLRHLKNSELSLRKAVSEEKLPAAMAVRGIKGTIDGVDYRNVSVVASMKKIPGTQWYLIAKIDREEVFSVLDSQIRLVVMVLVLFIATIGLFLGFLLWNQRVLFYRDRYESELNRLALFKHFDYILKFANDIILLMDKNLNIAEANDRALETYMYSRDEMIGMNLNGIQAPETLSGLSEQIEMVNKYGSATFETIHRRRDDTTFPVEISSRMVNIEGSQYYQTIGRDITERKLAEETLRESEMRFRKIFEESPFPMVITGKDFAIIRANASFCTMTGYAEEDLKLHTLTDLTHAEDKGDDPVNLMRLIAGDIPVYHSEKRYLRQNGSVIIGSSTISIIRNNRDEAQFFIGMVEDITLRKEAETELEKSFSLIKATLESTEDGILVVDLNGKIVQFNNKFAVMWRIPQEVLDRGNDDEALSYVMEQLSDSGSFLENVRHLYSQPEATSSDLLEFKDGRFFERYSQPQKISGRSVGRVWSFRDITQKKKAEQELISAKLKAEESDRLKTAFLHNVSHEIRTPMNAIIGFSSLLNEPDLLGSERQQYTEIIYQSSNQLLSIINDIVDVANIESGQVKVNMTKTALNPALRNLSEQFIYSEKQYKIPINFSPGLPDEKAIIVTDTTKLIQIISNLINNSIKFTGKGKIDFGYSMKDNCLEFFVKDTGIGIPQESIDKIFDRFYQVDRTVSRKFGGTGLGLSICKAYVQLLGGDISVTSTPGQGTSFIFTIPYLPVD
jgi:PAS domain S-box-containing protein